MLKNATYSLVFLGEKLASGDAWSLLPHVRRGARLVVVTRDPEAPLRAFEVNAFDYLVKPFFAERIANTLARLESAHRWHSSLRSPASARCRTAADRANAFGVQPNLDAAEEPAVARSDTGGSPILRLNS